MILLSRLEELIEELCSDGVEYVSLGEICNLITKGTTPKTYEKEGITFIKTEAIEEVILNKEKLVYVSNEIHEGFLKRSKLEENDILFAIAGSIGKCIVVSKNMLPANTNQALAIIRLKENVEVKYVYHTLQSNL